MKLAGVSVCPSIHLVRLSIHLVRLSIHLVRPTIHLVRHLVRPSVLLVCPSSSVGHIYSQFVTHAIAAQAPLSPRIPTSLTSHRQHGCWKGLRSGLARAYPAFKPPLSSYHYSYIASCNKFQMDGTHQLLSMLSKSVAFYFSVQGTLLHPSHHTLLLEPTPSKFASYSPGHDRSLYNKCFEAWNKITRDQNRPMLSDLTGLLQSQDRAISGQHPRKVTF